MSLRLRALREDEVPRYAARHEWPPQVHGVNSYPGTPIPSMCERPTLQLPRSERQAAPNGAKTGRCFQLPPRAATQTQPVLPTLFVPGFPKSATTWLFECMRAAFLPERVCSALPMRNGRFPKRAFAPQLWNRSSCRGRRYMLPGIACAVTGPCGHRKELFFYGSGFGKLFEAGAAMLHGPEVPLELFQSRDARPENLTIFEWEAYRVKRFESFCYRSNFTHLPDGRMHPSCCIARASQPRKFGCRWHETVRIRLGLNEVTWFQTAMPWVVPSAYNFASVDFTPNYLCSQSALNNIFKSARDPSELRFIVLMRDPVMRAYSEWSMFSLHWRWDHQRSLMTKFSQKMRDFKDCNLTLYEKPELLRSLPDRELHRYIKKCFRGTAMEYISNSIYSVCIMGALRVFKREQFLFLRFEDLMRMKASALVRLIANFTGLYTDSTIITQLRGEDACEARRARRKPLSFTISSKDNNSEAALARQELTTLMPELESFFAPYNNMLAELIHPAFNWGADTHRLD
ncbi:hypothetical protein AB1Y20_023655 [Prymnesium parvum]|uniref:Sulfotransferase domain-containing protein n=1 Tax=Prymnesium parvum TaxID=97485 RepID=A0AB34JE24_PRYPA